jgi:hypothetical protein
MAGHATEPSARPGCGSGSSRHEFPFQRWACPFPTARQKEPFAHETDCISDWAGTGVRSAHHLLPSHSWAAPAPTAMQNEVLVQDTELSLVVAADPAMTRHLRPFHLSASERPVSKSDPTATQNLRLRQDTAGR